MYLLKQAGKRLNEGLEDKDSNQGQLRMNKKNKKLN